MIKWSERHLKWSTLGFEYWQGIEKGVVSRRPLFCNNIQKELRFLYTETHRNHYLKNIVWRVLPVTTMLLKCTPLLIFELYQKVIIIQYMFQLTGVLVFKVDRELSLAFVRCNLRTMMATAMTAASIFRNCLRYLSYFSFNWKEIDLLRNDIKKASEAERGNLFSKTLSRQLEHRRDFAYFRTYYLFRESFFLFFDPWVTSFDVTALFFSSLQSSQPSFTFKWNCLICYSVINRTCNNWKMDSNGSQILLYQLININWVSNDNCCVKVSIDNY